MGARGGERHKLSNVDVINLIGDCSICGVGIRLKRKTNGIRCRASENRWVWNSTNRLYKRFKRDHCFRCGFKPKHLCQLDVDHMDNNHRNNHPSNLQTLCANCHRLKTYFSRKTETGERNNGKSSTS